MSEQWGGEALYVQRRPRVTAKQWLGDEPVEVDLNTPDGTVHARLARGEWFVAGAVGECVLGDEAFQQLWEPLAEEETEWDRDLEQVEAADLDRVSITPRPRGAKKKAPKR